MMYVCEECEKECTIRWWQDDNGMDNMHFESWLAPLSRCCDCFVRVVPENWDKEVGTKLQDYREVNSFDDYDPDYERSYYDD